ncbi:hypothetical protein [Bacillus subtilis]
MKHSFYRFCWLGEKGQQTEIAEHDTNKAEMLDILVTAIVNNSFKRRTIF